MSEIPKDVMEKMYAERDRLFPIQSKWQHSQEALLVNVNRDNYELNCLYQQYIMEINQRRTDFLDGLNSGYNLAAGEIERLKGLIEDAYDAGYADYDIAVNAVRNNWDRFKQVNNL